MGHASTPGLAWPPDSPRALARFPRTRRLPRRIHRLCERSGVWWFATLGSGGGRFDLPAPEGSCYLADDLGTALAEKLLRRPKSIVPAQRLRELWHARVAVLRAPPLADLTSRSVAAWGVNAEIHVALDYARPRAWAARLRSAGAPGLRYAVRSDPALTARAVALFGAAGLHARAPAGMRTHVSRLDTDAAARLLTARGVRVLPIPHDVPTLTR